MSQVALGLAAPDGSNRTVVREIAMKFPTSGDRGTARARQLGRPPTRESAALVAFHVPAEG